MKDEPRQPPSYPLRLAPDVRARLEDIAKANGRSLNAEIAMRLEASLQGSSQELLGEYATHEQVRRIALEVVREELAKSGRK